MKSKVDPQTKSAQRVKIILILTLVYWDKKTV